MSLHDDVYLTPLTLKALRPTQMTVGVREVKRKRQDWAERDKEDRIAFLKSHIVPVVLGPQNKHYLIDHHHLARALHEEGIEGVFITLIADLSHLKTEEFWSAMDMRRWAHPYDAEGRRQDFEDFPKHVKHLEDDPWRSLASELERAGGFAKSSEPFMEFQWADFLRRRISRGAMKKDFEAQLTAALALVHSKEAQHLPGWCGSRHRDDRS